jgi:hypothetical protein
MHRPEAVIRGRSKEALHLDRERAGIALTCQRSGSADRQRPAKEWRGKLRGMHSNCTEFHQHTDDGFVFANGQMICRGTEQLSVGITRPSPRVYLRVVNLDAKVPS